MVKDPMEELQSQVQEAQLHEGEQGVVSPEDEFGAAFDEEDEGVDGGREPAGQHEERAPEVGDVGSEEPGINAVTDQAGESQDDNRYKSMMGRLKAAQQENSDLKSQLSNMIARIEAMQKQEPPKQEPVQVEGLEDLPEDVRPLVQENSREGDAIRKIFEEYGPEHASVMAQSILAKREAENATAKMQRQYAMDNDRRHRETLAEAHPEFADAILGKNAAGWQELENGIEAWIRILPYGEGEQMARIKQSGTTQEVSEMLARYKRFRTGGNGSRRATQSSAASRIARSNVAVPGTGKLVPPKERATDYDSAWDEAPD